jgi:hypothetical protein
MRIRHIVLYLASSIVPFAFAGCGSDVGTAPARTTPTEVESTNSGVSGPIGNSLLLRSWGLGLARQRLEYARLVARHGPSLSSRDVTVPPVARAHDAMIKSE